MRVRKKTLLSVTVLVLLCLAIAIAIGAYIGVFDDRDSFFYSALGEFLYFRHIIVMLPFVTDPPQTLFGPIYALIILPLSYLSPPSAMISITALQILMIFASAGALAYVAGKILSPRIRWVAALLFIFFPFTVPYATVVMSEITAMFLVAIYLLLLYGWVYKKWKFANLSTLLLVSAILVLTRYVFIALFTVTFLMFFLVPVKRAPPFRAAGTIGILLIFGWILLNVHLHGIVALSNVTGRHLYNNVVSTAHIMPPYPNPKTNFFISRFIYKNSMYALTQPWWENEMLFNDGIIKQTLIDKLYMDVAIVSILHHPFQYMGNAIREFVAIPLTAPLYPDRAITSLRECPATTCRFVWNARLCSPAVDNCSIRSWFASVVNWETSLYPYPMLIFFIIVCMGVVFAAVRGPLYMRLVAGIFTMQLLFQSGTEWVEGRFLVPLYPLYILLLLYGAKILIDAVIHVAARNKHETL